MAEDTIYRQAAIDAAKRTDYRGLTLEDVTKVTDEVVKNLMELPSAQPERKKGKWIKITNINHTYICSECGRLLVNITDGENKVTKYYPFCHCGADMREGENE